jgi:hypothetical protein
MTSFDGQAHAPTEMKLMAGEAVQWLVFLFEQRRSKQTARMIVRRADWVPGSST